MIEVKGLYKDFGALHVLRGVSLNVEQGDIISIIGPSGSGKSTLLRSDLTCWKSRLTAKFGWRASSLRRPIPICTGT